MKKLSIFLLSLIAIATACNQDKPKDDGSVSTSGGRENCYLAVTGNDSASLSLDTLNGKVKGTLAFNFAEKDDLNGDIRGEFKGDTLFVDYAFKHKEAVSNNPLVFLKVGDKLVQGSGEIETYLGKTYFSNHSQIKFEGGFEFEPTDCP